MPDIDTPNRTTLWLPKLLKLSFFLSLTLSMIVNAQSDIHERWGVHNADSSQVIDHKPMTSILTFIAVPQDTTQYNLGNLNQRVLNYMGKYQDFLETVAVSELNKNEQLAYWLNLYNVSVIERMGQNAKQAKKIKKLRGTPGDAGEWWAKKSIQVEGVLLSLEDIEQHILARHWQDPLFIYGLFYGVSGDAFSSSVAFTGDNVERQLKSMARQFVNDKSNIKVKRGEARVSSLLAWNKASVFNGSDSAMLQHIREFANETTANQLVGVSKISNKHKFNWRSAIYTPPSVNRNAYGDGSGGYRSGGGGGYGGGS